MVRCGLIGCGNVATEMHLPALRALPEVQLESVCDTNPERLQAFVARFAISKSFSDVDTFLAESKDLDFVVVGTPGFTHYALTKRVIEHGLHVFVEKPLALRFADCLDLKKRAADRDIKVCVGQTWRFRDPVLRAREALEQGLVGRAYQINVVHHAGSLFHASEPPWSWREREHKVLLYEHAIHLLDLEVLVAGPVEQVVGVRVIDDPHLHATTHIYALVVHGSGAVGLIDVQAFASSNFTYFEIYGTANDVQIKFFPHGYRIYSGRINPLDEVYHDFLRVKDFIMPIVAGAIRRPRVPRRALPHYRLFQQFVQSLKDDSVSVPVTIGDVLPTMELLEQLSKEVYS